MLLTEAEGKAILQTAGVAVPKSILVSAANTGLDQLTFPVYVKAQVLYGNRELQGLVKRADTLEDATRLIELFLSKTDNNHQPITEVLVEEAASFDHAYYLSISYDTRTRQPVIRFSTEGGAGMDDRGESIISLPISAITPLTIFEPLPAATQIINQLITVFFTNDATLLEINPLVETKTGWVCLDAKIELESTASYRHPEWEQYPERSSLGRPPTAIEIAAQAASRTDHRGVAGESFFEFPGGTIGVLASGGGASTLAMDALMAEGLKPANYTEYSGNPPRPKVEALTKVVCSIPRLEAVYIVGSNANFTDIYETLAGVMDGFLASPYATQPGFVILIRRGGPRWEEAFAMVEERLTNTPVVYKLLGPDYPLVETATELTKLLKK